jgi:hypothetical protein
MRLIVGMAALLVISGCAPVNVQSGGTASSGQPSESVDAEVDPDAYVQMVLRLTSIDGQEDLRAAAEAVKQANERNKALHEAAEEFDRASALLAQEQERALAVTDELATVPGAREAFLAEPAARDSMRQAILTQKDLGDAITAAVADVEVAIPSPDAGDLGELTDDQSQTFEMHLKRVAELETTLANAMAKASETAASIIANIK